MTVQATTVGTPTHTSAVPAKQPLWGSLGAGLVASLCCGGSLVFGLVGLGAAYSALGFARYIPQALTVGTLLIVGINYWFYRRQATRLLTGNPACDCGPLRPAMLWSGFAGLAMMGISFIFLTWLEHGVVKAAQFFSRPDYGQALIAGVPNQDLVYVALTFLGLPLLALLPLPGTARNARRVGGQIGAGGGVR